MKKHKMFVYGTLMDNMPGDMIGTAETRESYVMANSHFPRVIPTNHRNARGFEGHAHPVLGQVWEVSEADIAGLDRYEGCPDFYTRQKVEVLVNDSIEEVWMYIAEDSGDILQQKGEQVLVKPNENRILAWPGRG